MMGYPRASIREEDLELQFNMVETHGCTKIFIEKENRAKNLKEI
ncbi:hypothetical protein bcere0002_14780 [Bacillus cereus ATCC 10876]|nr:hypothetical protein bcere0002_14780 [Bacillus cereus ATCC 10876]KFL63565.1 hypothetical protein DJ50_4949 [Bacillus cereus ATCC 10876]SUY94058.1 Uncharacterised protein [Bacillus cereus]